MFTLLDNDGRYTMNLEYCGYTKPKYVVRFLGEWVACFDNKVDGHACINAHAQNRNKILGGELC